MKPIWLKYYAQGVLAEINILNYASIKDMFEQSCKRFRELPAFTNMDVTLTYEEIDHLSRDFDAYLQHELGLGKSDRVVIMLPNLLQYPVALFGALRAGLVAVNINPLYTPRELQHQLADSGAIAVVVLENFEQSLEKTSVRHVSIT